MSAMSLALCWPRWRTGSAAVDLRRSVRWHVSHPPSEPDLDFTADEAALVTG